MVNQHKEVAIIRLTAYREGGASISFHDELGREIWSLHSYGYYLGGHYLAGFIDAALGRKLPVEYRTPANSNMQAYKEGFADSLYIRFADNVSIEFATIGD